MSLPDDVHTLAGRLATFEQAHHLKKRRASSSAKKKATTTSTVTWPHKSPAPEALARAGFFFKPTSSCPDNVTCFLCESSLDGWQTSDDPTDEHIKHSGECGWAICASINLRLDDPNGREEDPSSEKMVDARIMTFRGQWPHENKKGWRCKTKKMVDAGWCYDPTPDADDAVTCFYCGLALDGWEPKDEPLEEHRRRSPGCYFFNRPAEIKSTIDKASRGKQTRASRSSKTSRLSTQSNLTSFSEAPSFMSLGEPPAEDESVITSATAATVTSMSGKGRKKGKKAAAASKKTKKTNQADIPPTQAPKSIDDIIPGCLRPSVQGLLASSPPPEEEPPQARRTRKGNAEALNESTTEDVSEIEPRPKKGRPQGSKATKNQQRLSEDESQLHSELQAALEASLLARKNESTPRGKKRTSEGVEKVEESQNISMQQQPAETSPAQPKRTRRAKKGTEEENTTGLDNGSEVSLTADTKPKANAKGRKGKKVEKNVPESSVADIQQQPEEPTQIPDNAIQHAVPTEVEDGQSEQPQVPQILSQQPSSPPPRQPTPSVSPQSSDAENHPPSSKLKPAHQQPPVLSPTKSQTQTVRLPLATATPTASPSKRNVINGRLISAFPWQAADLETIFLGSPDKENITLTDALRTVSADLTSPEKKMSVEEWIKYNASKGEEKLRRDCERIVGIFETEGVKALKSLEGIECV